MNVHSVSLQTLAAALGGKVYGDKVRAPAPGKGKHNDAMVVWADATADGGFRVHCFNGTSWEECQDHVRQALGLPEWRASRPQSTYSAEHALDRLLRRAKAAQEPQTEPEPKPKEAPKPFYDGGLIRQGYALTETYDYTDAAGVLLYQVCRYEHPNPAPGQKRKDFRQRSPDGNGGWLGTAGDRKVLYRQTELAKVVHDTVILTEGEKDADRVARDLQFPAVTVASGKWSDEAAEPLTGRDVYILEDNDETGRKRSLEAAQRLHGLAASVRIVRLPDLPEGGDVSDWLDADPNRRDGFFSICQAAPKWVPLDVEDPYEPSEAPQDGRPPMAFLTFSDMLKMPEPEWMVEGLLQAQTAALLFGKSNSFKSFLGIDLACSIATGRDWHGSPVKAGKVLLVATEGANGVGRIRIPGWMVNKNIPDSERGGIFLWPKEVALDTPEQVAALILSINHEAHGKGFSLVVVDIFGGSMVGPETKDETARAWVHGVQRLIRDCGVTVLTIAHTGWADETRARMHTHFWGSFDTRLKAEGDKESRTTVLTVDRHKDADSSGTWGFRLDVVQGHAGTSTLVPVLDGNVSPSKAKRVSGKPLIALQALDEALSEKGRTVVSPNLPSCRVVELSHWRDYCKKHGLTDSDDPQAAKKAFQRARDKLHELGVVRVFENFVWRVA